jgi:negative regulator of genetic competence, sporulation and motility
MDVDPPVFSPRLCIILLYSTSNSISMTATTDYGVVACNHEAVSQIRNYKCCNRLKDSW